MQQQNLKNHARYVPSYHFITSTILLVIFVFAIINMVHNCSSENCYAAIMFMLIALVLPIIWFNMRGFALKAQDRAIRAEENFRHFILSGKPFDASLSMSQIIALRFASDAEFIALAKKAIDENLTNKQIKAAIVNWRADNHRA